ncbi:2TM domain-containing protein [Herbaspirillum sp.]|uniref:2TM domain-containing protein n=1 Tax=Herbaspirillum sp. TaxID=1890675 RepID=UPI001B154B9E|nr:2TM domain-containing protein [Herbaspirillum sp.]MBO9537956.1 2TM domain-containing protein [Herbaspirillum sp.]
MPQTEYAISDQDRRDAMRRVNRKLGFLRHLCIYLLVNAGLIALNLSTSRHVLWSAGPLLGWGIGVLFHALSVFADFPSRWRQALMERELRRHR